MSLPESSDESGPLRTHNPAQCHPEIRSFRLADSKSAIRGSLRATRCTDSAAVGSAPQNGELAEIAQHKHDGIEVCGERGVQFSEFVLNLRAHAATLAWF